MNRASRRCRRARRIRRGFTLIEVLLMVALGIILASVAIPNASTLDDQYVGSAARVLASDAEFARARAIATSQSHAMVFDAANERYTVESPPGTAIDEPLAKKPWTRTLGRDGAGTNLVSAIFGSVSTLVFDAAGRPNAEGTVVLRRGNFEARVTVAAVTGEVTLVLP